MAPKVSICIPTYKQTQYLKHTLDSIQTQDFHDYEIIITDDTPDSSVEDLVKSYNFNGKLKYIRNQTRKGSPGNWNEAVKYAAGKYIKVMHHDDWFFYSYSLRSFVTMLEENQNADFAFSAAYSVNIKDNFTNIFSPTKKDLKYLRTKPEILLYGNKIGPPSSTIFRNNRSTLFDNNLKWLVDIDFYITILKQNPVFVFDKEPLISSVNHADHNVSNLCMNKEIELFEYLYLHNKLFHNTFINKDLKLFCNLFIKYDIKKVQDLDIISRNLFSINDYYKNIVSYSNFVRFEMKISPIKLLKKIYEITIYIIHHLFFYNKPGISFSQCGEDLIMKFLLNNYLNINKPSYIDIGAHHPFYLNNTAIFYKSGSHGINIEPNPELIRLFYQKRKKDININIGVSNQNVDLDFYIMSNPTMSTFSQEEAHELEHKNNFKINKIIKVKVMPLNEILLKYFNGKFPDILTIDVEGLEEFILKSIDYEHNYPKVICIETLEYVSTGFGRKDTQLIDFLKNKGYIIYADTYINTIFFRKEYWKR